MRIRLAEELDDKANQTITENIQGKDEAIKRTFLSDTPEDDEEKDPLEERLVELGRVTQLVGHIQWEIHAPRHGGNPAVKLAINEITDSSKGISKRDGRAKEVSKPPEVYLMFTAENNRRNKDADGAPVVGHATDTNVLHTVSEIEREDNLKGMLYVMGKIVKKDITEPCADYESCDGPDKKVLNYFCRIRIILTFYSIRDEDICQEKCYYIHETVIANLKGTDLKDNRTHALGKMLPANKIHPSTPLHSAELKLPQLLHLHML